MLPPGLPIAVEWWQLVPTSLSALTAAGALTVAVIVYRAQRGWHTTDTLLEIVNRFEQDNARIARDAVYRLVLTRDDFAAWDTTAVSALDRWCADLDIAALLLLAGQVNANAFLELYGDVVLRSIFIAAPYANAQRAQRGDQFLLPLSRLGLKLARAWQAEAAKHAYPREIAFKYGGRPLTPRTFLGDDAVATFIRA